MMRGPWSDGATLGGGRARAGLWRWRRCTADGDGARCTSQAARRSDGEGHEECRMQHATTSPPRTAMVRWEPGCWKGARAGELRYDRVWDFCQSEHIGGAICEAAIGYVQGAWQHVVGPAPARDERTPSAAPEVCKLKRPSQHADRGPASAVGGGSARARLRCPAHCLCYDPDAGTGGEDGRGEGDKGSGAHYRLAADRRDGHIAGGTGGPALVRMGVVVVGGRGRRSGGGGGHGAVGRVMAWHGKGTIRGVKRGCRACSSVPTPTPPPTLP
jgi:hypothetical protein